jgi:hypothetical protein
MLAAPGTLLSMDDEDRRVLHEILGRGAGFGHRQHVELAWRYVGMHGAGQAYGCVAEAIREVAAAHGAAGKFHETITMSWVRCVAVHRERWPADSFEEFLELNPGLLDPGLLGHFYSPELLASAQARGAWVAPDLRELPALAA